jgi:hypothetical protein
VPSRLVRCSHQHLERRDYLASVYVNADQCPCTLSSAKMVADAICEFEPLAGDRLGDNEVTCNKRGVRLTAEYLAQQP